MPHFDKYGGDEWVCQVCGKIHDSHKLVFRLSKITRSGTEGNVCYPCASKAAINLASTTRGQYILSQALCLAVDVINSRPEREQEPSNVEDMKLLLVLFPLYKAVSQAHEPKK